MNNRESGPDILRCFALFCVTGLHAFLHNGFYYQPQAGFLMLISDCLRWMFYGCIGIFMMLTGYLKSHKKLSRSYYLSLIPILIGYVLTCFISFPVRHFLLDEQLTLREWAENLFTFGNYAWYVEMYIGLLLISPILNLALDQWKEPKHLLIVVGVAFCLTALPSITNENWIPDYWEALYPFTYYIIGAVIRRLQPKINFWLGAAVSAIWIGIMGVITLKVSTGNFFDGLKQEYGSFWVTIMVTLIFLTFYKVRLRPGLAKASAWLAGGCFEGYILSRLFDVWIYAEFPQWHSPQYYPLLLLCITVPVCLASVLLGKGTHLLAEQLSKPLYKLASGKEKTK